MRTHPFPIGWFADFLWHDLLPCLISTTCADVELATATELHAFFCRIKVAATVDATSKVLLFERVPIVRLDEATFFIAFALSTNTSEVESVVAPLTDLTGCNFVVSHFVSSAAEARRGRDDRRAVSQTTFTAHAPSKLQ